jgi:hypothetical protein
VRDGGTGGPLWKGNRCCAMRIRADMSTVSARIKAGAQTHPRSRREVSLIVVVVGHLALRNTSAEEAGSLGCRPLRYICYIVRRNGRSERESNSRSAVRGITLLETAPFRPPFPRERVRLPVQVGHNISRSARTIGAARCPGGAARSAGRRDNAALPNRSCVRSDAARRWPGDCRTGGVLFPSSLCIGAVRPG